MCEGLKTIWIGQSATKPRIVEGSTTIENTLLVEVSRVGFKQNRSGGALKNA